MNIPTDVLGRDLQVGQRVGCAFGSDSSIGYLRIGVIEFMDVDIDGYGREWPVFKLRWEHNNVLSPKIKYAYPKRWVIL